MPDTPEEAALLGNRVRTLSAFVPSAPAAAPHDKSRVDRRLADHLPDKPLVSRRQRRRQVGRKLMGPLPRCCSRARSVRWWWAGRRFLCHLTEPTGRARSDASSPAEGEIIEFASRASRPGLAHGWRALLTARKPTPGHGRTLHPGSAGSTEGSSTLGGTHLSASWSALLGSPDDGLCCQERPIGGDGWILDGFARVLRLGEGLRRGRRQGHRHAATLAGRGPTVSSGSACPLRGKHRNGRRRASGSSVVVAPPCTMARSHAATCRMA